MELKCHLRVTCSCIMLFKTHWTTSITKWLVVTLAALTCLNQLGLYFKLSALAKSLLNSLNWSLEIVCFSKHRVYEFTIALATLKIVTVRDSPMPYSRKHSLCLIVHMVSIFFKFAGVICSPLFITICIQYPRYRVSLLCFYWQHKTTNTLNVFSKSYQTYNMYARRLQ